jgi:hypothetical protein
MISEERAPQDGEEKRRQHVPGGIHPAVNDLERRDGQQDERAAEQGPCPPGASVARARVVQEQAGRRADQRPGYRVGGRHVRDRQERGDDLPDKPRPEFQVAVVRHQQVPRPDQPVDQEHAVVLGVGDVPGRDAADAQQQRRRPGAYQRELDRHAGGPLTAGRARRRFGK